MKNILIVEQDEKELEVAKLFFSTISGYKFIYVEDRKSAEKILSEVDAVITEPIMFYDKKVPFEGMLQVFHSGQIILEKARSLHIAIIILSDSGGFIGELKDKKSKIQGKFIELWGSGITKKDNRAWEMAWIELQKQF